MRSHICIMQCLNASEIICILEGRDQRARIREYVARLHAWVNSCLCMYVCTSLNILIFTYAPHWPFVLVAAASSF